MADAPIIIKLFTPLTVNRRKSKVLICHLYEATVGLPLCLLVQHLRLPGSKNWDTRKHRIGEAPLRHLRKMRRRALRR